jgi:hypothetical protein
MHPGERLTGSSRPVSPSPFTLLHFHIDLLRLGLLSLGEDDGEHPPLAARLYVIPVYGQGERKAPLEGAEKPLYAMVVLLLDGVVLSSLSSQDQGIVFNLHLDIILIHIGEFRLDDPILLSLFRQFIQDNP